MVKISFNLGFLRPNFNEKWIFYRFFVDCSANFDQSSLGSDDSGICCSSGSRLRMTRSAEFLDDDVTFDESKSLNSDEMEAQPMQSDQDPDQDQLDEENKSLAQDILPDSAVSQSLLQSSQADSDRWHSLSCFFKI